MTKNNNIEKKKEAPAYYDTVNSRVMNDLRYKVYDVVVGERMYREKDFSARKLADILHTNVRYISVVMNAYFQLNFSSFVNRCRVEEAKCMLTDQKYRHMTISQISDRVGFSNRQSFYKAFLGMNGCTPLDYRKQYFKAHPGAGGASKQAAEQRRKAAREAARQKRQEEKAEALLHPKKRGRPKKDSSC
ncbi:MAG: helix-turn-helix domain-containing protein [Prevotella sp.]|uniref:helix-turn-helix domain-containing protein n=1 Tax=Prevotella sp. AGR2160 TaxID=1280674 RepID=UPI0018CBC39F|nr:helix-turn-helix domain-containing protein [Prevotella sp. AGR2160]MDD5861075.1 helix-turn-helix domain-containing protein [Prevotella sp.]